MGAALLRLFLLPAGDGAQKVVAIGARLGLAHAGTVEELFPLEGEEK